VTGRLAAADRAAAERDVQALAARLGAMIASRRADAGAVVMEVLVPRDRYAEFVAELGRAGTWQADREADQQAPVIRVGIRLVH
jgi:hypothetical protein